MRIVVCVAQKVRVVGGNDWQPQIVGQAKDLRVQLRLAIAVVPLYL